MFGHDLVLKSDELYLVGDTNTDPSGELAAGLYVRDTRHLSRFSIILNGTPLSLMSAQLLHSAGAAVTAANRTITLPDGSVVPLLSLALEQHIQLGAEIEVRIALRNFSDRSLTLVLELELAADFRDLFEIRGFPRTGRRGRVLRPGANPDRVTLGYLGPDGLPAETIVAFDRPASIAVAGDHDTGTHEESAVFLPGSDLVTQRPAPVAPPRAVASFSAVVPAGEVWELRTTVTPRPAGGSPVSPVATLADGRPPRPATITTDNGFFNRFLHRCASDLGMLQTSFPGGSLPAAGIPWYVAPFGRDSLIVGLQTLHVAPERAADTLRVLAARQGTRDDPWRDEEPGKILHEVRYGEMARLGEIPHTPYFGTADATPLFVLLFAETIAWTGDERLYRDLLPNVRRALEWIERHGDRDGDGLVEYESRSPSGVGITHQGWKDSHDSLHHRDGRPASTGAIALVEVQAYVYAAYRRLAEVVAGRGDAAWAAELRSRAEVVRRAVEERFWLEDDGFYAQALDGDKVPVAAISSNPGHLLYCGLPSPERAARVAHRLQGPDVDAGWGIRTLSSAMPTYNPMSYHNGSIWPHDNSLIAAGLRAYGYADAANAIGTALFNAGQADPLARLPELYCGFDRAEGSESDAPVAYPVSCSPQAWAAGAGQLLVRVMLGLHVDIERARLLVDPALPPWLNEVTLKDMSVLGAAASLSVRRDGGDYVVETEGPIERPAGRQSTTAAVLG